LKGDNDDMSDIVGANFLSMELIFAVLVMVLVVIILSLIIRKLLWKKLDNEVLLAKDLYEDMHKEVFSQEWESLLEVVETNPEILGNDMDGLKEQFKQLSKELSACKLLIDDFKESRLNGMDLKGANSTLTFINGMMDNSMPEISEFYGRCKQALTKVKTLKKPTLKSLDSSRRTSLQEQRHKRQIQRNTIPRSIRSSASQSVTSDKQQTNLNTIVPKEEVVKVPVVEKSEKMETRYIPRHADVSNGSIVAAGSIVDGDIHSKENALIKGQVNGSVYANLQVEISDKAKIMGDVKASQVEVCDGKVFGSIYGDKSVYIAEDVYVRGDIKANYVSIEGAVEGNIEAVSAEFLSKSRVMGDIVVEHIHIEKGTKISGNLKMK